MTSFATAISCQPDALSWKKLGRIFVSDGRYPWMKRFGQVPTALVLDDRIRVYFSCRPDPDAHGDFISLTTFLDVDRDDPRRIIEVHSKPVIDLGQPGTFDQFGVMPCCVLNDAAGVRMYYVGWSRCRGVPWNAAIGLAISHDGGRSFERVSQGPVVSRNRTEPFVQGSPWVVREGHRYRMWYLSGIRWEECAGRLESIYRIMTATSEDGLEWERDGREVIPACTATECQARPAVWCADDVFHMLFSTRYGVDFRNPQRGYNIGYAWSQDGIDWQRDDDKAGLIRSDHGWDSEMIAYPNVVHVDGRRLCFYCGNMMGQAGFGVAELQQ